MEEVLEVMVLGEFEDDDIEYAIMDNILINREEMEEGPSFDINDLSDSEVLQTFRFSREDLVRLKNCFNIPQTIVTENRNRVDGFLALLILLRRLTYPCRLKDFKKMFNKSCQSLSQILKTVTNIIIREKGHLLENLNNLQWLNEDRIIEYAEAIHNKGGAINNCWGFIDGTARPICRPSVQQEEYYSGHKKFHCLKYQSVICPDGIIASLLGSYPGRRHDAAIFRESNLYEQLEEKAVYGNMKYVLFGDQGYGLAELLITPFPGALENLPPQHQEFNQSMKPLRLAVEWGFSKITMLFAFIDLKKNQKLLLQDVKELYKVAVLLTNAHTCLYGHQASSYFNINPPELEIYFEN